LAQDADEWPASLAATGKVQIFTHENAVDLHSVGRDEGRENKIDPVNNISVYHFLIYAYLFTYCL
jgi:hypothetical protein